MSAPRESDLAAPRDPAAYRPRGVWGADLWAPLAFGVVCMAAGAGLWSLAPRLLPHRPAPLHPESYAVEPVRPAPAAPPAAAAATPATPAPAEPSPEVQRLSDRVSALEAQQTRTANAAAAALAAAAAVEASQSSRPFVEEAAALRAVSPETPELAELVRLAQTGAPTRATLAQSFPDYAARAASAARKPGQGARLGDRLAYALSRVVMLRRIDDLSGTGVDAVLARAERSVEDGDFDQALRTLDALPPAARDAMAPWRMRAERRAAIDRYAASLRARALQDLAAASRSPP